MIVRTRHARVFIWSWMLLIPLPLSARAEDAGAVRAYVKDYELKVEKETLDQKRWYLERGLARVGAIEDPRGVDGRGAIRVADQSGEQRAEPWHTVRPGNAELYLGVRLAIITRFICTVASSFPLEHQCPQDAS